MAYTQPEMTPSPSEPVANPLDPALPDVEAAIDAYIGSLGLPANLDEGVRYAVLGGGKRLRPAMVLGACRAAGGDPADAIIPAAAVEMMHAFTLVHDDLPAMDDDDLRRGRPTVHIVYGEALAILIGDCLMGLATQIMADRVADPALAGLLIGELSRGATNVIAGQVYDTMGGLPPDLEPIRQLELIHENKTGALFRAACRMGAIAATWPRGADHDTVDALGRFGASTGLIFQIVDDLLDVEQTTEQIGKRTSKDSDAGKLTYPGVLGVDASRAAAADVHAEALAILDALGDNAAGLRSLSERLLSRTR